MRAVLLPSILTASERNNCQQRRFQMHRHSMIATFSALLLISATPFAHAKRTKPTPIDCDVYAHAYASDWSRQGQVFGSTALGAGAGFGLGSIWAAAGAGAGIGAGVGLIVGLMLQSAAAED